ncbi:MAG: zinc ribbon domain-containing protein [Verrucomicrobiales bacterium]
MLPSLTSLLILQDRDHTLRGLKKDLERIPAEIARARTRMEGVTTALDNARKVLNENELAIRKIEMDVKTRRDSIQRLHLQRFETRKNEEYTAMGHEIENYEGQVRGLEDQELEYMEKAEQLKASLAAATSEHSKVKVEVEAEIAAFGKRKEEEEGRMREVEVERANAAAAMTDEAALELYERLAVKKFPPIVPLEAGDICGGCHVKLTGGTAGEVRLGKRLVSCDHCGRIVYST